MLDESNRLSNSDRETGHNNGAFNLNPGVLCELASNSDCETGHTTTVLSIDELDYIVFGARKALYFLTFGNLWPPGTAEGPRLWPLRIFFSQGIAHQSTQI